MTLPDQYAWLSKEPGPKMIVEALKLFGTVEGAGAKDNPTILAWAKEVGLSDTYSHDETAWCGLFCAVTAKRAGWDLPSKPLWARDWAKWGKPRVGPAMLGDVLVFPRGSGGHVAIYVGEDATHFHILGGNQSDKVCIVRKAKNPILAVRQAPWRLAQPPNVRRVFLSSSGAPTSIKEA